MGVTFNQVYQLVNAITNESVGGENITVKDTASLVTLGEKVLSKQKYINVFYDNLASVIGRITTHYQAIRRKTRGIERTPIDFGIAVLEYTRRKVGRVKPNTAYQKPQVNPFTLIPYDDTDFEAAVYSVISGWQIQKITYEDQLTTAFHNEAEMANFLGMIFQDMYDAMTKAQNDNDAITECTAIAQSLLASTWTPKRQTAFNFWTEFKKRFPSSSVTFAECRNDTSFLKFCGAFMRNKIKDAGELSNLFNVGGAEVELDEDFKIHVNSEFASDMTYFLQADTYHKELIELPNYEEVVSWQGFSSSATFDEKTSIAITNDDVTVVQSGIVAHLFSSGRMFTMIDRIHTESQRNSAARATNWYHSAEIGSAIRRNDIGIVFYIAETDFDNNFLKSLSITTNTEDADTYGKSASELQKDISFNGEYVFGTLNYVTDYTGYSSDTSEQEGNYFACRIDLYGIPENVTPTITLTKTVNDVEGDPVVLDETNTLVLRVPNNTTELKIVASASGYTSVTKKLKFTHTILAPEA